VVLGEVGAVIGAHVGPGMVAVVVAPALSTASWSADQRPAVAPTVPRVLGNWSFRGRRRVASHDVARQRLARLGAGPEPAGSGTAEPEAEAAEAEAESATEPKTPEPEPTELLRPAVGLPPAVGPGRHAARPL